MDHESSSRLRRRGGGGDTAAAAADARAVQPQPQRKGRSSKRLAALAAVALALLALRVAARAAARLKQRAPAQADQQQQHRLFTAEELSRYTGSGSGGGGSGTTKNAPLYMAILGEVFDVGAKPEHYGPGAGYHHFAGGDGSRAFVTGEFAGPRRDSLEGLAPDDVHAVVGWRKFYFETYPHKGRLIGRYYDARGAPTPALAAVEAAAAEGAALIQAREAEAQRYVECGAGWTAEDGGRVWCDGGQYPRKLFEGMAGGAASWRCVCMPDIGWSDLLQVYPDCAPDATECAVVSPADGGADE